MDTALIRPAYLFLGFCVFAVGGGAVYGGMGLAGWFFRRGFGLILSGLGVMVFGLWIASHAYP